MPSLKDLRNRIASVKATQKITKAMQMVAAATICMALVIFCVAFTEAMRLRRSFKLGIERPYPLGLCA